MSAEGSPASTYEIQGPWELGSLVSRYVLLLPLSRSTRAEVWLAQEASPQPQAPLVAIKRFLVDTSGAPARIEHPHVAQVLDEGTHGDSRYWVMEYCDGEGLSIVRRMGYKYNTPIPTEIAAYWISMAALGLSAGAASPSELLVHGRLSPQNVLATFDGGLKILNWKKNHSSDGAKIAYMSPEQARGEKFDARSDVFSLGSILFELVTNSPLYPGEDARAVQELLASSAAIPTPSQRRADVPEDLEPIIIKALFRKTDNRYQTPLELHQALEEWLARINFTAGKTDAARYLRSVFARRIHERRQLIETSRDSEGTRSAFQRLAQLAEAHHQQSASTTNRGHLHQPPRSRTRALIIGATSVAFIAAGAVLTRKMWLPHHHESPPAALPSASTAATPPEKTPEATPGSTDVEPTGEPPSPPPRSTLGIEFPPTELPNTPKSTPSPKPKKSPADAQGRLSLKTTPWSTVYLGAKNLGDTPLIEVPLPVGRHRLRLVNPEAKLEKQIDVNIEPNQTTIQKLTL